MKRRLLDLLACPITKDYPLELHVFEEEEEIVSGLLICPDKKCGRWYPIIDEIPHMLPDDLRDEKEDKEFLRKWEEKIPKTILGKGKPFNLADEMK
jgi:uncharacterized protein YbaR (Trm112 family)